MRKRQDLLYQHQMCSSRPRQTCCTTEKRGQAVLRTQDHRDTVKVRKSRRIYLTVKGQASALSVLIHRNTVVAVRGESRRMFQQRERDHHQNTVVKAAHSHLMFMIENIPAALPTPSLQNTVVEGRDQAARP